MSRKTESGSPSGRHDFVGGFLLLAAILLLLAQLSFNAHDIAFLNNPPTHPAHNFVGPIGAYIAWWVFLLLGIIGYFLPFLIAVFGAAYLLGFLTYLRDR